MAVNVKPLSSASGPAWIEDFVNDFTAINDCEKNIVLEAILRLCGPKQLRFLYDEINRLVKRDFLRFLPKEIVLRILKFLDFKTIACCSSVSKTWKDILSHFDEVWFVACKKSGFVSDKLTRDVKTNWKMELKSAFRRVKRLQQKFGFSKRELEGHTSRVTALCYKNGLLASGSNDRTILLWDVSSGTCKYQLTCHTCTDLKFDETQVITASCDNTLARWDWSTGNCLTKYQGHVGSVFCVDYSSELDLVVSGSSDCTIKFWQMSTGSCLATKLGHKNWLTSVLLPDIAPECQTKLRRKHVVVSMSKECIKVWSTSASEQYACIATMTSSNGPNEDLPGYNFLPKLLCNGREIICSSQQGVCFWNLETLQLTRGLETYDQFLVAYGDIFSLCWKNNMLHVINNKTGVCLWELPAPWSKPKPGYRYSDCQGEGAWLNSVSAHLETGPIYFSPRDKKIVIIEWRTNPGAVKEWCMDM